MLCELYKRVRHRSRIKSWGPKVWRMGDQGVRGKGCRLSAAWGEQVCITVRTVSNNILATKKLLTGQILIIIFIVYFMSLRMGFHYDIQFGSEVLNSSSLFPSASQLVGLQEYVKFVRSTRCFDLMKRQYSLLVQTTMTGTIRSYILVEPLSHIAGQSGTVCHVTIYGCPITG